MGLENTKMVPIITVVCTQNVTLHLVWEYCTLYCTPQNLLPYHNSYTYTTDENYIFLPNLEHLYPLFHQEGCLLSSLPLQGYSNLQQQNSWKISLKQGLPSFLIRDALITWCYYIFDINLYTHNISCIKQEDFCRGSHRSVSCPGYLATCWHT